MMYSGSHIGFSVYLYHPAEKEIFKVQNKKVHRKCAHFLGNLSIYRHILNEIRLKSR